MQINKVTKILCLSISLFLFSIVLYRIKCPTVRIISENPLIIEYANGSTVWWEFSYITQFLFDISLLGIIMYLIPIKRIRYIILFSILLILVRAIYSSILMFKNIHSYDIMANSVFWIWGIVGLVILILWTIKYLRK